MKDDLLTDEQVAAMLRDAEDGNHIACEHLVDMAADRTKLYAWILELENDLHRMHEV